MSRSKHQAGSLNARRKAGWRSRVNRLGRHLRWRGKRLSKTDEPYDMQVVWPFNLMDKNSAAEVADWALNTPNRWWLTVTLYGRDQFDKEYTVRLDYDTGQQCTADELAGWRVACIEEAKAGFNASHLWLETVELGIY